MKTRFALLAIPLVLLSHGWSQDAILSFSFDQPVTAGSPLPVRPVGQLATEPGIHGQAGTFDGSTWIEVPHHASLNAPQWTIAAWACPQQEQCGGRIIEKGASNSFWLTFFRGHARFGFYSKDAGYQEIDSATRCKAEEWRHVAGTYDGKMLRIYVDGNLEAMKATSATPNLTTLPMAVGAKPKGVAGDVFIGALDEVRFYPRALSDAEIAQLGKLPEQAAPSR